MLTATESFLASLEKWIKAVRADEFGAAKRHAEFLIDAGELLAIHPDFIRCYKRHDGDSDPKDALLHMCHFLMCATDGRASVLKQYVKDNSHQIV